MSRSPRRAVMSAKSLLRGSMLVAVLIGLTLALDGSAREKARRPVRVQIQDDKTVVPEPVLPTDPLKPIQYQPAGNLGIGIRSENGQTLHLSHYPMFRIDDQIVSSMMGALGNFEVNNGPLPRTAGGKERTGFMSVCVRGDLRITMTAELVPTKPADRNQKRRLDTILIRYSI